MQKTILYILGVFMSVITYGQSSAYLFHHTGPKNGLSQGTVLNICQDKRGFLWTATNNSVQRFDGAHFISFFPGRHPQFPAGIIYGIALGANNRLWIHSGTNGLGYLDTDKFTYHAVKVVLPAEYNTGGASALQVSKDGLVMLIYPGRGMLTYNEAAGEASTKFNPFTIMPGWEPRHLWQDEAMNYWAATANGLLKFNTQKKLFSYSGQNNENDATIKALENVKNATFVYKDKTGRFWVGSWQPSLQIKSYNKSNDEIKCWENIIGTSLHHVYYELYGIQQMKDGSIWAHGPGLFAKLDYENNSCHPVAPNTSGEYSIRYELVNQLFEDRENSIWVCTNKGLFRFNPTAHLFHSINNRLPGSDTIYEDDVTGILETRDGELLVSTWGRGIFCYDSNFNPIVSRHIKRNDKGEGIVWCMLQNKEGDIWRGGQDGILWIYHAKTKKNNRYTPAVVNGRTIRQMAEDKNGNIWLGTHNGSLIKWNKHDNRFYLQQKFRRFINRLYIDEQGNVWACTENDGVYCIRSADGSILNHFTASGKPGKKLLMNGATDILQYNDSTFVIASNGLNILNIKTGVLTYWSEGEQIYNLAKDRRGTLWLSTNAGIISRDISQQRMHITYDARDGIYNTDFSVGAGYKLKDGRIIFGTSNDFIVFDTEKALELSFELPHIQVAGISVMNKWLPVDSVLQLPQLTLNNDKNSIIIRLSNNNYQNLVGTYYMLEGVDNNWKQAPSNGEISLNYLPPGKYIFKATNKDHTETNGKIIEITIVVKPPFYKSWWFYATMALLATALYFWIDRERQRKREAIHTMRSNIAGSLHQQINKTLHTINILSEMAQLKAGRDIEKSKEFIEQINNKSQQMILAMDDMLWSIDPANDNMEKTIVRMQEYIATVNLQHATHISMHYDEQVKTLQLNMELRHELLSLFKTCIEKMATAGIKDSSIKMAIEKKQLVLSIHCALASDQQKLNALLHKSETLNEYQQSNGLGNIENITTGNGIFFNIEIN